MCKKVKILKRESKRNFKSNDTNLKENTTILSFDKYHQPWHLIIEKYKF